MFFDSIKKIRKEINSLLSKGMFLRKEINRLLGKGVSNIYLKLLLRKSDVPKT